MEIAIFVDLDHTLINKIGRSNRGMEMKVLNEIFNTLDEKTKNELVFEIKKRTKPHSFVNGNMFVEATSIIRPNGENLLAELNKLNADIYLLSHGSESHIESAVSAFDLGKYFSNIFCSRGARLNLGKKYDLGILLDDKYDPQNPNVPKNKDRRGYSNKRADDAIIKKHSLMLADCDIIEHIRVPPYNLVDEVNFSETITNDPLNVSGIISDINKIISYHSWCCF